MFVKNLALVAALALSATVAARPQFSLLGDGLMGSTGSRPAAADSSSSDRSPSDSSSSDPPSSGSSSSGCGVQNGNRQCPVGQCCSAQGQCGTTANFCRSPECQNDFGKCDADIRPTGKSTRNIPRPKIGEVPYGRIIRSCKSGTRDVAITFDDGPFSYTDRLLDILDNYNVKATFFVTGINLSKGRIDDTSKPWPAMIKRAYEGGHHIASHTWSHADLSTLTSSQQETEMVKLEMALRNIINVIPTYMRPPYISCSAECLATMDRLGYHVAYYDLDTEDYKNNRPETNQVSKDIVTRYLEDQSVDHYLSIAHDIHEQTVNNLTVHMLEKMKELKWNAVTFAECLGDPKENWYRKA